MNNIFTHICFFILLFSAEIQAQNSLDNKQPNETIEGLSIYPNPATNGKLHIITTHQDSKTIEIFDVLGKRVIAASILGNELDISRLNPGIYVVKVTENKISAVKKLIVK